MSYFGQRLRYLRKQDNITQQQLAAAIGMAKSSISMYENGHHEPDFETIEKIADYFNVPMGTLFPSGEVSYSLPSNVTRLEPMEQVPLVGQIACGTPILAEENIEDYVDLPRQIKADFALLCKGDSMTGAGIQDGDVVYIHQQVRVENGEIAAVLVGDDEATLKRFYYDGKAVQLVAENPKFPPLVFTGDEIQTVQVIGRAVAFTHSLV